LAEQGFRGVPNIFDGDAAYWTSVSDKYDETTMIRKLGDDYHIVKYLSFKPWSSCRHTHAGIMMVLDILREGKIKPEDIEEIRFKSHRRVYRPQFMIQTPKTMSDSFWSVPWAITMAILGYEPGPDWYAKERYGDQLVREIARRIVVEVDPEVDQTFHGDEPEKSAAKIELVANGKVYRRRAEWVLGDPKLPMTKGEIEGKFRSLANRVLKKAQTEEIIKAVDDLEQIENMEELARLFGSG